VSNIVTSVPRYYLEKYLAKVPGVALQLPFVNPLKIRIGFRSHVLRSPWEKSVGWPLSEGLWSLSLYGYIVKAIGPFPYSCKPLRNFNYLLVAVTTFSNNYTSIDPQPLRRSTGPIF